MARWCDGWLISADGRYRIAPLECWHGRVYAAWLWDPAEDWGPVWLANRSSQAEAIAVCDLNRKFGGAP